MPLSEGNTRAGFQIAFKSHRSTLIGEFDDEVDGPGAVLRSVDALACVMNREASLYV